MFFVTGEAGAVGELAALCAKGKPANMHQDYAHAHERNRKTHVPEPVTCILNIPWRWKHTELSETDKFDRVSYSIAPFNQKCIYEWE